MEKFLKIMGVLDWVVGTFTIVGGLYFGSTWVVASGVLGLLAAYYKPAVLIKKALERKFLRKQAGQSDSEKTIAEDAFYSELLSPASTHDETIVPNVQTGSVSYSRSLPPCTVLVSGSKHNILKVDQLNLAEVKELRRKWA